MMQNNLLILLLLLACGCQSGPVERSIWKPWTWRGDKSSEARKSADAAKQVKAALADNSDALIHAAGVNVSATGEALNNATNREPAVRLAQDFNAKAGALLPKPTVSELGDIKSIVSGLLSTNATLRADAERRLDVKDRELADLQRMTGELRAKLDAAEQSHEQAVAKLTDAYASERGVADKWRAEQAKAWGRKILDLLGTGGLIALASTGVLSIPLAGRAFGLFSRIMPASATLTGVVSQVDFTNAVGAVEQFKTAVKAGDVNGGADTVLDALKAALAGAQNPAAERLVDATRVAVQASAGKRESRKLALGL